MVIAPWPDRRKSSEEEAAPDRDPAKSAGTVTLPTPVEIRLDLDALLP